jgi:hypothetical protein
LLSKGFVVMKSKEYQKIYRKHFQKDHFDRDEWFKNRILDWLFYRHIVVSISKFGLKMLSTIRRHADLRYIRAFQNILRLYLFKYRYALPIKKPSNYLDVIDKSIYEIDYGYETRPAVLSVNEEELKSYFYCHANSMFRTGLAFLENKRGGKKFDLRNLNVDLSLLVESDSKKKIFEYLLPVSKSKHGFMRHQIGQNWIDLSLDLSDFSNEAVKISFKGTLTLNKFLMFKKTNSLNHKTKEIHSKIKSNDLSPIIAWGNPQILTKNNPQKKKNIILLSFESFTDPDWLSHEHKINADLDSYYSLCKDSVVYRNAFSQVDSTRPFSTTMLFGLLPSQHGMGRYDIHPYQSKPIPAEISSLAELLKRESFYCSAKVPYNAFSSDFGLSKGFDTYYCTERPEMNNATDASWVIKALDSSKNHNSFVYSHIQRLHPPFLSTDDRQSPQLHNIADLSNASDGSYLPLYSAQMGAVDFQLSQIIGYLKESNQYENSMIVILGDHGVGMPPWFEKTNNEYAHFEMRSRIPFLIKWPNWCNVAPDVITEPTNATLTAFKSILESCNIELPDYMNNLFQNSPLFNKYAMIETIYHPKLINYAVSLITNDYKFWMEADIDWVSRSIKKVNSKRLYKSKKDTSYFDETKNLLSKDSTKNDTILSIANEREELARQIFNTNSIFYRSHFNDNS